MTTQPTEKNLGDNLFLRWSTIADKDKIAHLLGTAFLESADEPFNDAMADWITTCTRPDFPFSGPEDWAIVEDRGKPDCPIVACTCFWSHQWRYADISFGVGRPEFVGTDPEYRNRGLIRAIFGLLHERSEAKGHLLQAITGIPYFYRLFDYEYVLDLGGRRTVQVAQIPEQKDDETDLFSWRLATNDDLPTLMDLYDLGQPESLIWHDSPASYWQLLINLWKEQADSNHNPMDVAFKYQPYVIQAADGKICGFAMIPNRRLDKSIALRLLCLSPTVNVSKLAPFLLNAIKEIGEQVPCWKADTPLREIVLGFGRHHPVYDALGSTLAPNVNKPYAWYIRVPDLPAFIRHIAPILEERISNSMLVGHTGELKIDQYRAGLRLCFEQGKLTQAESWKPVLYEGADAGLPPLIFLQLLLCYRSLDELRDIFPDVWAKKDAALLLNILFPKLPSVVHPLA